MDRTESSLTQTPNPVFIDVPQPAGERNRLTVAFRIILSLPHALLVGGPAAAGLSLGSWPSDSGSNWGGGSGGVLGVVAGVCALISWFAIVFTGKHPEGLWNLAAFYLRWRVRAIAYISLFRDEYPPFGDGPYPVLVEFAMPQGERDRVSVGFRLILAIPHLIAVCILGVAWCLATVIAWFSILFTGEYPKSLFEFSLGVLRWSTRVEAYLLLLHDDYPPFSLD